MSQAVAPISWNRPFVSVSGFFFHEPESGPSCLACVYLLSGLFRVVHLVSPIDGSNRVS